MNRAELNYFREQKHYSLQEIEKKLNLSEKENLKDILGTLKKFGIVKAVSNSEEHEYEELSDPEIIADSCESGICKYKFCFTGIAVLGSHVFCCYPKYIDNNDSPKEHLKLCLNAIRKYNSSAEQLVRLYNWNGEGQTFNRLAISLYILNDYYENGIYSAQKEIIETNGSGEIYWDRTINETFALLRNNRPYYFDLQTINTQENEQDFIKQLHKCIITECSEYLEYNQLLYFFGISHANISSQKLIDFGSTEYIKYRLEKAIAGEFITKKQNLLKTLYAYVAELENNKTHDSISLYGTNSFNLVWEKALAETLDSSNEYFGHIEKTKWIFGDDIQILSDDTLTPDILTEKNGFFYILDAKYYYIELDRAKKRIRHQPGTPDIVKQFAYHKALANAIAGRFKGVCNAFLIPMKSAEWHIGKNAEYWGKAEMPSLQQNGTHKLEPVQVAEIAPEYVLGHYLSGTKCEEIFSALKPSAVFGHEQSRATMYWDIFNYGYAVAEEAKAGEYGKGHILAMAGYLRQEYFAKIEQALQKGKNRFIFYFYFLKNNVRYPHHCELNACQNFIGFAFDEKSGILPGKAITGTIEKGSCRLETRERLMKDIEETGLKIQQLTGQQYFAYSITGIEIKPITPAAYAEICRHIENYPGNNELHKTSPKVCCKD